jgi:hypothetical protein
LGKISMVSCKKVSQSLSLRKSSLSRSLIPRLHGGNNLVRVSHLGSLMPKQVDVSTAVNVFDAVEGLRLHPPNASLIKVAYKFVAA